MQVGSPTTCNPALLFKQPLRACILNHTQLKSCPPLFLIPPLKYATEVSVAERSRLSTTHRRMRLYASTTLLVRFARERGEHTLWFRLGVLSKILIL